MEQSDILERLMDGLPIIENTLVPDFDAMFRLQREAAAEITRLRAALADAQAVGFAAGVEAAAGEVNGWKVLGGYGELVDKIRALTPQGATAAAARVLLGVWPNDASFDAAFNACAASYHGGDQMQDEMDRTLATVSAALRAIAGDTP